MCAAQYVIVLKLVSEWVAGIEDVGNPPGETGGQGMFIVRYRNM
jgi:hypothetical protein